MADEQQAPAVEAKDTSTAATSAETKNTDTEPQELMIPKHRYDEVAKRLKAIEDENAKRAAAQKAEDEKRLQEQQQWQQLAEKRKGDMEELKPKAELADKLSALVLEQYAAEIKEWPEQVKAMAPGDDADVLTKLDWMRRAKPLAIELMADKAPAFGNGRSPRPAGSAATVKTEQQSQQWQQRAAQRYR
jgi:hypothetical protein